MKRLFQLRYWLAAALMVGGLAACDENEESDWKTGDPVKAGCQQVHFVGSNLLSILNRIDENDRTVTIGLERNTTSGALTVPIKVVSKSEGITEIPTQAVFADGAATTEITVVASTQEVGTSLSYVMEIEGDEIDPYLKTEDGSSYIFSGTISFPRFRRAKCYIYQDDSMGAWEETVLDLGENKYVIEDLMHSGMDLQMSVDTNNKWGVTFESKSEFYYKTEDENYPGCFYCTWWNSDDQTYIPFYPFGRDANINFTAIDIYEEAEYSYYSPSYSTFYITLDKYQTNTGITKYWPYMAIEFIADDDPFEPYLPEQPQEPEEPDEPQGDPIATHRAVFYFPNYENEMGKWEESVLEYQNGWYKIENWMESGVDFLFKNNPNTNELTLNSTSGNFVVEGNYMQWNNTYFYPHGQSFTYISDISLCYITGGYAAYDPDDDMYGIGCYVTLSTWSESAWAYLDFYFIADDDPFTPIIPDPQNPNPDPDPDPVDMTARVYFGSYDSQYNFTENTSFGGSFAINLQKVGDSKFIFKDFMNSKVDVTMEVAANGDISLSAPNCETSGGYWGLYDEDGYYLPFYPNASNTDHYIGAFSVYVGETGYSYYSNGTIYLNLAYTMDDAEDWTYEYCVIEINE